MGDLTPCKEIVAMRRTEVACMNTHLPARTAAARSIVSAPRRSMHGPAPHRAASAPGQVRVPEQVTAEQDQKSKSMSMVAS